MPLNLVNHQNVVFSDNTYNGPFVFDSMYQGDTVSWAQWSGGYTDPNSGAAIKAQDAGSTFNGSATTPTTGGAGGGGTDHDGGSDHHDRRIGHERPTRVLARRFRRGHIHVRLRTIPGFHGVAQPPAARRRHCPDKEPNGLLAGGRRWRHVRLQYRVLRFRPRTWVQPGRLRAGPQPEHPHCRHGALHDGHGYFMVASDGGVFAFGDAHFAGSCPGIGGCVGAAVAVVPDATGNGYWVITKAGDVYGFGDARYFGAPGPQSSP